MLEVVIVAGMLVLAGVGVLLGFIVPRYLGSGETEKIFAAYDTSVIAAQNVQQLSLEGFSLRERDGTLQSRVAETIDQMERLTGLPFCAAVYINNQPNPLVTYFKDKAWGNCLVPSSHVQMENDFTASLDPIQTGEQVGVTAYPRPGATGSGEFSRLRPATSIANSNQFDH